MSEPFIEDQAMNHLTKLSSQQGSCASFRCLNFKAGSTKQKTSKSLIIWLLVVYGLIQVTSNLINSKHNHHHTSSERSASFPPHQDQAACSHFLTQDIGRNILSSTLSASNNHDHHNYVMQNFCDENKVEQFGTIREQEHSYSQDNTDSCSSPTSYGSLLTGTLRAPLACLKLLYNSFACQTNSLWSCLSTRAILGPGIILADAAQVTQNSMYQTSHDREIIVLNSTNFNTELIQYNHPFPHIKLIEYYLPYCGICLRFKQTYIQLSKDIFSWRNVIRLSAIDLGVSNNSPIAHSWSIDVVPTLRIHPPPKPPLAAKLNEQLSIWSHSMRSSELQKAMYQEYSEANLMIDSLGVIKYTNDSKRDSVSDKVSLLKHDLMRYIDRYVRDHNDEVPETWPNLRPVAEKTLADLRRHHPRQELFLVIESNGTTHTPDDPEATDSLSSKQPGVGFEIIMRLSSSAAWKAIRYVRASDNKDLLEDVIAHKKKELNDQADSQNNDQHSAINEKVELLNNLLSDKSNQNSNFILVHIDDSHSSLSHSTNAPATKFPFLEVITSSDLITTEQQHFANLAQDRDVNVAGRSRRALASAQDINDIRMRMKRSLRKRSDSASLNNLSLSRQVELVALYINQTYMETKEDREFLSALNSFDENPTSHNLRREAIEKFQATQQENQVTLFNNIEKQKQQEGGGGQNNSTFKQFFNRLNPSSSDSFLSSAIKYNDECQYDDYEDKLKAIRYIFFQEVPRKSFADKSPAEKAEKLNTLINLASVIKAYFPLPDLASVQFIDAIHNYLSKQQTLLLESLNGGIPSNFDLRSLKQVIKNIEADGKRLPEVRHWKHCKYGGYPCALWRLFHTLTAFEYRKLSQIYQLSTTGSQQPPVAFIENHSPSAQQSQLQQAQALEPSSSMASPGSEQPNSPPSPVERLVSPPSTTTSLSLTIATPISSHGQLHHNNQDSKKYAAEMAELPTPVLLVMRDYIVNFFSCEECARNFRQETADLSFERTRRQEPAEFSILWLWETHNRVSKRLSINPETNPLEHPKKWFPTYEQCSRCYKKPPSYLKDTSIELAAIFHESIEWNRDEVLNFLHCEFTKQPMDTNMNIFGYPLPYGLNYIIVIGLCLLFSIVLLRCASCYIERQRRHKASMLNGVQYSEELQRS